MADAYPTAKKKTPVKSVIAKKIFTDADQLMFATMSGDFNPMHMEVLAARKLLTGKKIVHGVHLLISAIDFWLEKNQGAVCSGFKSDFKSPVSVGDCVVFCAENIHDTKSVIRVYVGDLLCLKITLSHLFENRHQDYSVDIASSIATVVDNITSPLDLPPVSQINKKYLHSLVYQDESDHFVFFKSSIGSQYLVALCSLSYFPAMVCPGLYSLLSSIDIKFIQHASATSQLLYSVERFDERFGLFYISVKGIIDGDIAVFRRSPPIKQPSMSSLLSEVKRNEFSNTKSLIIGGSRGVGECTAKILTAGDGKVIITYANGFDDAIRVRDEISAFASHSISIAKFDVLHDPIDSLDMDFDSLDVVYYFATPKIFRKKALAFDQAIYAEFFAIYVEKFYSLCCFFENKIQKPIKFYLPSSVAVEEHLADLAEYAMAKAAAEILAEEINRSFKYVSVIVSRLPRMDTDQTATIAKIPAHVTSVIMLPLIRSLYAKG